VISTLEVDEPVGTTIRKVLFENVMESIESAIIHLNRMNSYLHITKISAMTWKLICKHIVEAIINNIFSFK
jgi:hypothetical protein